MAHQTVTRLIICCLLCISLLGPEGSPLWAGPYFDDGYLGLTQSELHDKLGLPQAVRDRKSALRVFTYYPITVYFSVIILGLLLHRSITFSQCNIAVCLPSSSPANEAPLLPILLICLCCALLFTRCTKWPKPLTPIWQRALFLMLLNWL